MGSSSGTRVWNAFVRCSVVIDVSTCTNDVTESPLRSTRHWTSLVEDPLAEVSVV